MENKNINEIVKKASSKRNRKRWVSLMSAVVLLITTNQLVMPADTISAGTPGGPIYNEENVEIQDPDELSLPVGVDGEDDIDVAQGFILDGVPDIAPAEAVDEVQNLKAPIE